MTTNPNLLELASSVADAEQFILELRRQGEDSPWFFAKEIAGYRELTYDLHQPVLEWVVETEPIRRRGILMPRKFFKSSMVKGYVLRRVINNPEIRVLFVGENDLVGSKNLQDIKWNIQSNPLFQQLYPHVIPSDYGKSWSETAITVPRKHSYDEPTIQTIGIGAKHTGFHYDLIVYDDPIGLVAAHSAAEMRRAIDWFRAAPGLLNSEESEEIVVGTRWKHGRADLYGWIMEKLPFRQLSNGKTKGYKWYIRKAIEDGKSIFPPQIADSGKRIGYSISDLNAMRERQGPYLFNANMMNDPSAMEGADFPDHWLRTYRMSDDRHAVILEGRGQRIELSSLVRTSVYDPSSGGRAAECENAIVVIGCDPEGRIIVLDRWAKNCGFAAAIEQWHVMNDKWRPWQNWFEAVGAHKEVAELVQLRDPGPCRICGKTHLKLRPRQVLPPSGSKEDRIRDFAGPAFETGRVYLGEHMLDLRKQITEFPHSPLVDMFDALAYAISKSRRPVIVDDKKEAETRDAMFGARHSRVYTTFDYGGYT